MTSRQILLDRPAFPTSVVCAPWEVKPGWPAKWVALNGSENRKTAPVVLFRLQIDLPDEVSTRIHVSASERYELRVDGQRLGSGPERGHPEAWSYETYEIVLPAGRHVLVARVWALAEHGPIAQLAFTHEPTFLLAAENKEINEHMATGLAAWKAARFDGIEFRPAHAAWRTGVRLRVDGRSVPQGWETGQPSHLDWQPVSVLHQANNHPAASTPNPIPVLCAASLPPAIHRIFKGAQVRHVSRPAGEDYEATARSLYKVPIRATDDLRSEHEKWQALFDHQAAAIVPSHTRRRIILELPNYLCAYPELILSGGAGGRVRLHWAESLYDQAEARTKGNRALIEDKFFSMGGDYHSGIGNEFLPAGGVDIQRLDTLWWECGRYIELLVETAAEPLTFHSLHLWETRYPLDKEATLISSDHRLETFASMGFRTLQMCAHETYMDCPFYEQLMYVGDTRIQALISFVCTRDARLTRKAIELFDASRLGSSHGLTASRYPAKGRHIIPPFSLWWIGMLHDYALWRGDLEFLRKRMAGARTIVDILMREPTANGLMGPQAGWQFVDWSPPWKAGIPPNANAAPSAPLNLQLLLALQQIADLEEWLGEPELSARSRRRAATLAKAIDETFWEESHGLWADDPKKLYFSEHSQCLAVLTGAFTPEQRRRALASLRQPCKEPRLAPCTIYFSHYKLEALVSMGVSPLAELAPWWQLSDHGFVTTPETPEPSRSDCHAWGAHPLYHFYASIMGIRPASPGFRTLSITPRPGDLSFLKGSMPHPAGGTIEFQMRENDDARIFSLSLPEGLSGTFHWEGKTWHLEAGSQKIETEREIPPKD